MKTEYTYNVVKTTRAAMRTLVLLLAITLLHACKEETTKTEPDGPAIRVYTSEMPAFTSEGGSAILRLESEGAWTAQVSKEQADWCHVNPSSGTKKDFSTTVSVLPNTLHTERNAQIILTNTSSGRKAYVTVRQKQIDYIALSSSRIEVGDDGASSVQVEVASFPDVTFTIDAVCSDWVHAQKNKVGSKSYITLDIDRNNDKEPREGYLILRAGNATERLSIYQKGTFPKVVISQHQLTALSSADTLKVELMYNTEFTYQMPDVDWLSRIQTRGGVSYSTIHIAVAPNTERSDRKADIIFYISETGQTDTVHVVQKGRDALMVARSYYYITDAEQSIGWKVNSSAKLSISKNVSWIYNVSPTSQQMPDGLSVYNYVFKVLPNISGNSREGIITFSTTNGTSQRIVLHQGGRNDNMKISFLFNGKTLYAPTLRGYNLTGTVKWGDGFSANYSEGMKRTYSSEKERNVEISTLGAKEVCFEDIVGVSEITINIHKEQEAVNTESFRNENVNWEE